MAIRHFDCQTSRGFILAVYIKKMADILYESEQEGFAPPR